MKKILIWSSAAEVSEASFNHVRQLFPSLGCSGFACPGMGYMDLDKDRAEFVWSDQTRRGVTLMYDWLLPLPRCALPNRRIANSYGLKHFAADLIERQSRRAGNGVSGYSTQGEFIAAALLAGYLLEIYQSGAYVNIASATIKALAHLADVYQPKAISKLPKIEPLNEYARVFMKEQAYGER